MMVSALRSRGAAASTSSGESVSLAPFTTMMRFWPLGSTKIGATPLETPSAKRTYVASIPCASKFLIVAGPNRSLPTFATMPTFAPRERVIERGKVHVGAAHNRNKGFLGHHFASDDSARGLYKNPAREPHKLSIAKRMVSPLAPSQGNAARFSGMPLTGSHSVSPSSDSHSMRKQHHAPRF